MVGVEIDPARVAAAQPAERPGLTFLRGGYELPDARTGGARCWSAR